MNTPSTENAANAFIVKRVHEQLLQNIRQEIMVYKKNSDLKEED